MYHLMFYLQLGNHTYKVQHIYFQVYDLYGKNDVETFLTPFF